MSQALKDKVAEHRRKRGRQTLYSDGLLFQAGQLAGLGFSESQIAHLFRVEPSTLMRWKKKHPELCNALEQGKNEANKQVASAMFQAAIGGGLVSEKEIYHKDGTIKSKERVFAQPNVLAGKYWLNNRAAENWHEDKSSITNVVNNKVGGAGGNGFFTGEDREFGTRILGLLREKLQK